MLLYCSEQQRHFFRVYASDHTFTDYDIRHDDLSVTISGDALASFYRIGEARLLNHNPQVLGLAQAHSTGGQ